MNNSIIFTLCLIIINFYIAVVRGTMRKRLCVAPSVTVTARTAAINALDFVVFGKMDFL